MIQGIHNKPQNSKESLAALTFTRLMTDYNLEEYPFWKHLNVQVIMYAWKGKAVYILFSQLFSHWDFDTLINLIYMSYLDWYDAKFIKKSWSFQNCCVFPLFSRKQKSATWISSKLLIFSVDQPGLEPGTSRLWVC